MNKQKEILDILNEYKKELETCNYIYDIIEDYDFEKIAERVVKLFAIPVVSQQRELLVAYENFKLMTPDKFNCAEQAIDKYLATN